MGWHQIKIRPADALWSQYVRRSARKCEIGLRCIPQERYYYETGQLDISYMDCVHIFGRKKESVRFDRRNTLAGCKSCHKYFHDKGDDFVKAWYAEKFGQRALDILAIDANTTLKIGVKFQDDMVKLFCKKELEKLGKD